MEAVRDDKLMSARPYGEDAELIGAGGEPQGEPADLFATGGDYDEPADLFATGSDYDEPADHSVAGGRADAENNDGSHENPAQSADRSDTPPTKGTALFSAYAVASQVGFLVIIPLLVFIWGGSWLVNRFSLPGWLMVLFVFLGIFVMISSVTTYLYRMIRMYGGDKKPEKNSKLKHDVRDHDYYND